MKKSITQAYITSVFLLLSTAFGVHAEPSLQATVSILPQKYFVERIAGSHVAVSVMAKPNSCGEEYNPSPKDILSLAQSQIYFAIGIPFEQTWLPRFKRMHPAMKVIHLEEGILRLPLEADNHHHHLEDVDPHIWLSPDHALLLAERIKDTLIAEDPSSQQDYKKNYISFAQEIAQIKAEIQKELSSLKSKTFIVFHPTWGYFAQAFGLEQIPIEWEGKEAKPKHLQKILTLMKEKKIKAIFIQPQFSRRTAETVAQASGARLITVDPLDKDWPKILKTFAQELKKADDQ